MHIAVDISPIDENNESQHKVRGVGKYITLLQENLEHFDSTNSYTFTSDPARVSADIIHYPYFDPFFITLPFKKKPTTIVTVHDVIPLIHSKYFPVGIKGLAKWNVNKILLRKVDGIITDSYASKEDLLKLTKISSDRITPVYLAIDQKNYSTTLNSQSVLKKYKIHGEYFLYVGDVTWNKNLPRIVTAIKESRQQLVMVGKALSEQDYDASHPWNADRVEVFKAINGNMRFKTVGFVPDEDLEVLYRKATALLMPSLDEGFGFPVLEAMSLGCPVITSQCGSLPEVGGDAVVYVDPYSTDDIKEKLEHISMSEQFRIELSSKGLKQAEKFSVQKMINDTVEVYKRIYNEKNS